MRAEKGAGATQHESSAFPDPGPPPAAAPARLQIAILGGLSLSRAGRQLALPHRKARAILAYLAVMGGGPVSRERLADLLWSSGEARSRHALRTTVFELKRVLAACGIPMSYGADALSLEPGTWELDLSVALASIARGEIPASLAAYPGNIARVLAGCEDLSEGVSAWIRELRADVQLAFRRAIGVAMADHAIPRASRKAIAELATRVDPLDEAACRALMQFAAEDGETSVALRTYTRLYEGLDHELGMEPAEETQALVAAIKVGRVTVLHPVLPQPAPPQPALPPATLAVLPLAAASPDLAPFADGIHEGTIHVLSGIGDLFVIARGTAMRYGPGTIDPREVGRELGVAYVLSGRVSDAGGGLRVTTELVSTSNGVVIRSDRHEVARADRFGLHDRIAELMVATLAPAVKEHDLARARRKPPAEQTAYDLMLQGVDLQYALSQSTYDHAGALLEEAIRRDPGFAPAHAYLATWHNFRIGQGWSPDRAADAAAAERHAAIALDLDRNNAVALAIHGQVCSFHQRNYRLARRYLDRALEVGPSCPVAWTLSSATHSWTGQGAEAVAHARRALALSPRDPFAFFAEHMLSQGHYMAGEYDAAIAFGQRVEDANPRLTSNLRTLAAALVAAGDRAQAREVGARMLRLEPEFRLGSFEARTPLADGVRGAYVGRLRLAGLPD